MGPARLPRALRREHAAALKRRTPMLMVLAMILVAEPVNPLAEYQEARQDLERARGVLSAGWAHDARRARNEARATLLSYFEQSAFPAWQGTAWNFYGTTTTPREGTIACGYFVTTVLEQAGFRIERVLLAQQASAWLVSTLARGTRVDWIRPADNAAAVKEIHRRFGDGLFVIGFDFHVGFLRLDHDRAAFCHASFIDPGVMTCEDPVASGAFASRTYVVADALNDSVLDDWVLGRKVPSVLPAKPRRD